MALNGCDDVSIMPIFQAIENHIADVLSGGLLSIGQGSYILRVIAIFAKTWRGVQRMTYSNRIFENYSVKFKGTDPSG